MSDKANGRQIQNELLGAGYVEAFNAVLHEYSEEVCFGRIWAWDGIDRKLAACSTLSC
jgi:4-carboxymuconolactone decarboxylase